MTKTDTAWGIVHSAGGELGAWEQRPVVRTDNAAEAYVLYGPYIDLPPGAYGAAFSMRYSGPLDDAHTEVAVLDVFHTATGEVIACRPLTALSIVESGGRMVLPFKLRAPSRLEFRLYLKQAAPLIVDQDRDLYASEQSFSWMRARPADDAYGCFWALKYDGFLIRNFDNLKRFAEHGVAVAATAGGAVLENKGLRVTVRNGEDLQVYTEVFVFNGYAFSIRKDVVCIDVGMNVGMASLYFANLPNVLEVHSYEPFQAPRERALQNFAMNPDLANKIKTNDYGLADRTEDLVVDYDPAETISVSIKGSTSQDSQAVPIKIVDAAEALGPLIRDAKLRGLGVVLKIDCEGSEFAIVRSLRDADLLRECDVVMMEWHKWFSKDLDEKDLIEPLSESGHVVFDRTRVTDEGTGLLFSVLANGHADRN